MGIGFAWMFPVGAFILLPLACIVSYGIGLSRNDIQEVWPFVSDTGAVLPDSCIFGQLLNMSAGLMMVSLYLRHRHIMAYFRATKEKRKRLILSSRIFLGVGIFASFGMMLVANFQERTIVVVHFVGALIAFFLGLVYGWYQTLISFLSPRKLTPRWIAVFRLFICIIGSLSFVGLFARNMVGQTGKLPANFNHTGHLDHPTPKAFYRDPHDPGYAAFLVTTISEWCLAMCLALFFLTLAFDLREVNAHPIRLELLFTEKPSVSIAVDDDSDFQVQLSPVIPQRNSSSNNQEYNYYNENPQMEYQIKINRDPTTHGIPLPGLAVIRISPDVEENENDDVEVNYRTKNDNDLLSTGYYDERENGPRRLRRSYDIALNNDVNNLQGKKSQEINRL